MNACGVAVAMLRGQSWARTPSNGLVVNVGTGAPRGVRGSCRGERTRPLGRRSAPAEAEGSPKRGTPSKVGAALTTPGRVSTVRWPRVRQARQDGVTKVNQCSNAPQDVRQLESDGSGLVSSAQSHREVGRTRRSVWFAGRGGHGEGLRRNRGDAAGAKLGTSPVERSAHERGNHPSAPSRSTSVGWAGRLVAGRCRRGGAEDP
jgi:hypothetical protein